MCNNYMQELYFSKLLQSLTFVLLLIHFVGDFRCYKLTHYTVILNSYQIKAQGFDHMICQLIERMAIIDHS